MILVVLGEGAAVPLEELEEEGELEEGTAGFPPELGLERLLLLLVEGLVLSAGPGARRWPPREGGAAAVRPPKKENRRERTHNKVPLVSNDREHNRTRSGQLGHLESLFNTLLLLGNCFVILELTDRNQLIGSNW